MQLISKNLVKYLTHSIIITFT